MVHHVVVKSLLVVLCITFIACVPEADEDEAPPVGETTLEIASPCVGDVQGLGGDGFGWLGLRSDGTVWKGFPAQNVPGLTDVTAISDVDGESLHHCAIKSDGSLWCWGINTQGQCGNGAPVGELTEPYEVPLSADVLEVAVSWDFTCALLDDNTVWCWGGNAYGQIGTGATSTNVLTPTQVTGLPANVSRVSAGYDHVCVIAGTDLWCWGGNLYGQIGAGDYTPPAPEHLTPELVMSNVQFISAGGFFNCAIDTSDQLWCWGDNASGHLGLGLGDTSNRNVPTMVPGMDDVAEVDTGVRSACGLNNDGSVECWGFQGSGRLGDGVYAMDDVTQREAPEPVHGFLGMANGASTLRVTEGAGCAVAMNGSLWCWGWGEFLDGGGPTAVPVEVNLCDLPMITMLDPASGSTAGGTHVVIHGDSFQDGATVDFGNTPGTNVTFVSQARIEVDAPAFFESTQDVTVTNPDGTVAQVLDGFQFLPPPAVWQVTPSSGSVEGGDRVVVLGSGLQADVTVTFDDADATDPVLVDGGVEVTTPAHAAGVVGVTVTNPDGGTDTTDMIFEFVVPPTPVSLDVAVGPTAGGTRVIITGDGFDWTSAVTFGGVPAESVTFADAMTLSVYTPAHDEGVVDIVVTNEDGLTGTLVGGFTFDDDPDTNGGGGGGCCSAGNDTPPSGSLVFALFGLLFVMRRKTTQI
jgi:alpha-tubulin suppressor-like RCC1 family protein